MAEEILEIFKNRISEGIMVTLAGFNNGKVNATNHNAFLG